MIPFATDAPIYHWPKATVGLIVANVLVFAATAGLAMEQVEPYMLIRGEGLHPVQWVTTNFLHAGPVHLIGNMIFLWAFGLVVEGKIGSLRFLGIYLAIGVVYGALMQILPFGGEADKILGASAAIYGLLGMCLIWAPRNDFSCLMLWRFVPAVWEIPIFWFAIFYIGCEALEAGTDRLEVSSALLHSVGAALGLGVGVAMLRLGWVDCENWDLFAVIQGRTGRPRKENLARRAWMDVPEFAPAKRSKAKGRAAAPKKTPAEKAAALAMTIGEHVAAGDADAAVAAYRDASRKVPGWAPPEAELMAWIKRLHADGHAAASIPMMRDIVGRFPGRTTRLRLKLAQTLIELDRPARALRDLAEIPDGSLAPDLETFRRTLAARARRMQEQGVLELEED